VSAPVSLSVQLTSYAHLPGAHCLPRTLQTPHDTTLNPQPSTLYYKPYVLSSTLQALNLNP